MLDEEKQTRGRPPHYAFREFPKWAEGVLVQDEAEELALRAKLSEAAVEARQADPVRMPSPAAVRIRRSRERRRAGKLIVRCGVTHDQIVAMVRAGLVTPSSKGDASEVAQGVLRLLEQLVRSSPDHGSPHARRP